MDKNRVESLLKQYTDDGFRFIDIELFNGEIIGMDNEKVMAYYLGEGEIVIHYMYYAVTIKYANIKNITV